MWTETRDVSPTELDVTGMHIEESETLDGEPDISMPKVANKRGRPRKPDPRQLGKARMALEPKAPPEPAFRSPWLDPERLPKLPPGRKPPP